MREKKTAMGTVALASFIINVGPLHLNSLSTKRREHTRSREKKPRATLLGAFQGVCRS